MIRYENTCNKCGKTFFKKTPRGNYYMRRCCDTCMRNHPSLSPGYKSPNQMRVQEKVKAKMSYLLEEDD